jgi:hypothetical protein
MNRIFRAPLFAAHVLIAIAEYMLTASSFAVKKRCNQLRGQNKKAEPAKVFSFGSSAIFSEDPPLSPPFSQKDRLCREIAFSH